MRLSSGRNHGTSTLYTSSSTRVIARMTHQVCFTSSHSETNISQTTYGFSISEKCCFVFVCGLQGKTPVSTAALFCTLAVYQDSVRFVVKEHLPPMCYTLPSPVPPRRPASVVLTRLQVHLKHRHKDSSLQPHSAQAKLPGTPRPLALSSSQVPIAKLAAKTVQKSVSQQSVMPSECTATLASMRIFHETKTETAAQNTPGRTKRVWTRSIVR